MTGTMARIFLSGDFNMLKKEILDKLEFFMMC